MPRYKLSIPEPCSQDWNQMTPAEQGRFCSHCSKVVRDFRNVSVDEIAAAYQANKGELCIRVNADQLSQPAPPPTALPAISPGWRAFIVALITAFTGWLFVPQARAQRVNTTESLIKKTVETAIFIKVVRGDSLVPDFPIRLTTPKLNGNSTIELNVETNKLGIATFKAPIRESNTEVAINYSTEEGVAMLKQKIVYGVQQFFVINLHNHKITQADKSSFEVIEGVSIVGDQSRIRPSGMSGMVIMTPQPVDIALTLIVMRGDTLVPNFPIEFKTYREKGSLLERRALLSDGYGELFFSAKLDTLNPEAEFIYADSGEQKVIRFPLTDKHLNDLVLNLDSARVEESFTVSMKGKLAPTVWMGTMSTLVIYDPYLDLTPLLRTKAERDSLRAARKHRRAVKKALKAGETPPQLAVETTQTAQTETLKLCELSAKVCPNPNPGEFTVWLDAGKDAPITLTFVDLNGNELLSREIQPKIGRNEIPMSVPNVTKGVYLLRARQLGEEASMKVVIY